MEFKKKDEKAEVIILISIVIIYDILHANVPVNNDTCVDCIIFYVNKF